MPSGGLGNFFFSFKKRELFRKGLQNAMRYLHNLYFTLCINSQIQRVNMLI